MGGFYTSMHFKTDDHEQVVAAAKKAAKKTKGKALVRPVRSTKAKKQRARKDAWVSVYPDAKFTSNFKTFERLAKEGGAEHVIVFVVHDDSVLYYWLFRGGEVVDFYNSCPDYFGECEKADLEAKGDARTFAGILDAAGRKRLAKIIKPRMINGEDVGGEVPVFEAERLEAMADLLGIDGAVGSYDYLTAGERMPGVGPLKTLIKVR